jgi:lysozyme
MKTRQLAAGLAMTAAGFAAYLAHEGYSPAAVPPLAGDVPTYGFGTTRGPDDKPLVGGEKITPVAAVKLALRDVTVHEGRLKACMSGVALTQHEYDALVSLALNVGTGAVCASSIPAKARAGRYAEMCKTILDFSGFCAQPKVRDGKGRLVCPPGAMAHPRGLTRRREAEYKQCMGETNA